MKKTSFLLLVLIFCFCSEKHEHNLPRVINDNPENSVKVNAKTMLASWPHLLAVNFINDTIASGKNAFSRHTIKFDEGYVFQESNLKIIIDTTYQFSEAGFCYENLRWLQYQDGKSDTIGTFKADKMLSQPIATQVVLIFNNADENALLERENVTFAMIWQALDRDGEWKPIEFVEQIPTCSPYMPEGFLIKPKHYFALSCIKYHGDFKTKLRIKFKSGKYAYYSNEINGSINRTQFSQDYVDKMLEHDDNLLFSNRNSRSRMFLNPICNVNGGENH